MAEPRLLDPEMDMRAAELALGLLEGTERLEAERLRLDDPAFAAAVDEWERTGLGWLDEQAGQVAGEAPSEAMWARIEASLARRPVGVPTPAVEPEDFAPAVEPDSVVPMPQTVRDPGLWRPFALAASLAALVFAGLWAFAEPQQVRVPVRTPVQVPVAVQTEVPVEQPFRPDALSVAQINGDKEQGTLLSALYDRKTGKLYLRLADIPDDKRVPELWLIDDAGTPRSLGFGRRDAVSELQLSKAQQAIVEAAGTIAVSLEKPAEAPHETPSKVLGTANLARLGQS